MLIIYQEEKPLSCQLFGSLRSKKSAAWHNSTVFFINLLELHHTEKKCPNIRNVKERW